MPVHDWTRVDAGTFHTFHTSWITHLMEAFNGGLLPTNYYALSEQVATRMQADPLTLHAVPRPTRPRRRLAIRQVSGHRVVAVVEIVSPTDKDCRASVRDLAEKVVRSLEADVQVLLLDLLPLTKHAPGGIHGAVWSTFDATPYRIPEGAPLALVSYVRRGEETEAYLEPVAVGQTLSDMPLFLNRERYVNVPVEATYMTAYRGLPAYWRGVIEGQER